MLLSLLHHVQSIDRSNHRFDALVNALGQRLLVPVPSRQEVVLQQESLVQGLFVHRQPVLFRFLVVAGPDLVLGRDLFRFVTGRRNGTRRSTMILSCGILHGRKFQDKTAVAVQDQGLIQPVMRDPVMATVLQILQNDLRQGMHVDCLLQAM